VVDSVFGDCGGMLALRFFEFRIFFHFVNSF